MGVELMILLVVVVRPGSILDQEGYRLLTVRAHIDFIVLPYWEIGSLSYIILILTIVYHILEMPSARLISRSFDSTRNRTLELPHKKPALY